jgi:hypothetical protein
MELGNYIISICRFRSRQIDDGNNLSEGGGDRNGVQFYIKVKLPKNWSFQAKTTYVLTSLHRRSCLR